MVKSKNALREFASLQRQLTDELQQIRSRLAELNLALGTGAKAASPGPLPVTPRPSPAAPATEKIASGEKLGMREAIQQATAASPLGVRDITAAMHKLGFRFRSKNPYNSVGAYLYGKEGRRFFKKIGREFSPLGRVTSPGGNGVSQAPKKRKMSAAGRRAIAEAARRRWAKVRRAGK